MQQELIHKAQLVQLVQQVSIAQLVLQILHLAQPELISQLQVVLLLRLALTALQEHLVRHKGFLLPLLLSNACQVTIVQQVLHLQTQILVLLEPIQIHIALHHRQAVLHVQLAMVAPRLPINTQTQWLFVQLGITALLDRQHQL